MRLLYARGGRALLPRRATAVLVALGIADSRSQIFNMKFVFCNPEGHARDLQGSPRSVLGYLIVYSSLTWRSLRASREVFRYYDQFAASMNRHFSFKHFIPHRPEFVDRAGVEVLSKERSAAGPFPLPLVILFSK